MRTSATVVACLCASLCASSFVEVGCRTRPLFELAETDAALDATDGGGRLVDQGVAFRPDLGAAVDAGPCSHEEYGDVALSRIELIDPAGSHHLGALVRVKLVFPMHACDYVATTGQHVSPGNATDGVVFTTYLWRRRGGGPACDLAVEGSRVVDVDGSQLSNLRLLVRDGAPGGTATLEVTLAARPVASCKPTIAWGQPCQLDCQCVQPNGVFVQCIPTAPGRGVCARMCAEDSECTQDRPLCDEAAAPAFTCTAARAGGACPHACAFGTSCRDGACRPQARPADATCRCDGDCPGAQLCDQRQVCFVPCFTVSACPETANYCGYGKCGFR